MFNGITFRRYPNAKNRSDRNYYIADGRLHAQGIIYLHREIWKFHKGEIPECYHVHHRDENPLNNDISNLELRPEFNHLSEHAKNNLSTEEGRKRAKNHMDAIRPKVAEWHRSEEGRTWHRQHGLEVAKKRPKSPKSSAFVLSAAENFTPQTTGEIKADFAHKLAMQSTDATIELTTKQGLALCAAKNLGSTGMKAQRPSRKCAGVVSGNARRKKKS